MSYVSRLGALRYGKDTGHLEKALESLHGFWVFVSIILIVYTAFAVVAGVWIVSVGATLPGLMRG